MPRRVLGTLEARSDFNTFSLAIVAVSTLVLAAIGIYGLAAYPCSSDRRRSVSGWRSAPRLAALGYR